MNLGGFDVYALDCLCLWIRGRERWGRVCLSVLWRAVPCRVVPCRAVPCSAVQCRAVPCCAVSCRAVLRKFARSCLRWKILGRYSFQKRGDANDVFVEYAL